jgi:PQQ-dependent catabolism-associated CXXCW motif protein
VRLSFALFIALSFLAAASTATAETRIALIIGNGDYASSNLKLINPANDAVAMQRSLQAAGFDVILKVNATRVDFYRLVEEFSTKIGRNPHSVGLFYYAGHGVQVNGENYLIPVDANIQSDADLEAMAFEAGRVLRAMKAAQNEMNIVILDACRDNPLPRATRGIERGLARMDAPSGTFIAYAAAPGQAAHDGAKGTNGVFTGELIKAIAEPGVPLEQMFKKVIAGVAAETHGQQQPWSEASIQGEFFFHGPLTSNVIPAAPITPAAPPAATDPGAFELAFWNSVKDAKNAAEIKTYLDRYPRGTFAGIAKVKYDELRAEAATPSSPVVHGPAPTGAVASAAAPQPASGVTVPSHPPNGFAGELTDFGVQPQSTLQYYLESATPTSIPGGHVITTEALANLNRSALLLIDAWNDQQHPTLPGAIRFPYAGSPGNFYDQVQAGFQRALAMRTNNNPQQPLVFFCAGVECWESYNAALRALWIGYREVYWYRGGVTSWQAAGLPLYPP